MLSKPWKVIKSDTISSDCKIFGNNHWIEIEYAVPEWNEYQAEPQEEECFTYKGKVYFLSEFMVIGTDSPFYMTNDLNETVFDGYSGDSFFSGVLVKYEEHGDAVKAYTYIS